MQHKRYNWIRTALKVQKWHGTLRLRSPTTRGNAYSSATSHQPQMVAIKYNVDRRSGE